MYLRSVACSLLELALIPYLARMCPNAEKNM